MGIDPQTIDPELEELVTAIAADPRATRFNIDPRKLLGGFRDGSLLARPTETGLTAAERELLRTHKSEAGYLLRALQLKRSLATPYGRSLTQVGPVPSTQALHRRAAHLQEHSKDPTDGLLDQLVRKTGTNETPSGFKVIAASLALDPTASGVVYLVNEYYEAEDLCSGEIVAHQLLERGCPSLEATCAWQRIARAASLSGRPVAALDAARQSVLVGRQGGVIRSIVSTGLTAMLVLAVKTGNETLARIASEELSVEASLDGGFLRSQAARLRATSMGDPFAGSARLNRERLDSALSDEAKEFLDATA